MERASEKYHEQLTDDAKDYLESRGITEEAISRFRLGVAVDPEPGHEQCKGWLTIPYLTPSGSVVSIRFRNLSENGPKYLTVAGDMPRLYNTEALERGTLSICVTEGEFDCIIAEMCGLPTVGVPGANNWDPIWSELLDQYEAVFVLSDDDDAGQEFPLTLSKNLSQVRNVPMATGEPKSDVNTFYLKFGAEELRKKVGVQK